MFPPLAASCINAHNCSWGLCPSSLDPRMLRAGSAFCQVSSPSSVSFLSCPAFSLVASWLSALPRSSTLAGSTAVPVGVSKPYSRRNSMPCLGLELPVPAECLVGVPALLSSVAVPHCGSGGGTVLGPPICSPPPPDPCAPVPQVMGGVSSPSCPRPSSPSSPSPAVVTLGVSPYWGNYAPPGASVPCGESTPPSTPWQDPSEFSVATEASRPPSSSPTPKELWATPEASRLPSSPLNLENSPARFSRRPAYLPLCADLVSWRHRNPTLLTATEEAFPMSPLWDLASSKRPSAPLSYVPPAVAVYGLPSRPIPPPTRSSPLHLSRLRPIPRHSIRRFLLHSLLRPLPSRGTPPPPPLRK